MTFGDVPYLKMEKEDFFFPGFVYTFLRGKSYKTKTTNNKKRKKKEIYYAIDDVIINYLVLIIFFSFK